MYTVSARHVGTTCCHEKADEVGAGPETKFRILCVGEGDAAGLPDEVRGTVRVREVERDDRSDHSGLLDSPSNFANLQVSALSTSCDIEESLRLRIPSSSPNKYPRWVNACISDI